jgi:bacillithiol system protein YtxJ
MAEHPTVPVYLVDVIAQRLLSRDIAARLGIRHESPQAIVLRNGAAAWHASHYAVTAEALARIIHEDPMSNPGLHANG